MRSKTLTCTLAAVAVTLAVALTSVRLQRPEPEPISATAPVSSSSTPSSADPLPTAAAAPTTQVIDPAADGGPDPLPSSEVQHRSDAGDGPGLPVRHSEAGDVASSGDAVTNPNPFTASGHRDGGLVRDLALVADRGVQAGDLLAGVGDDEVAGRSRLGEGSRAFAVARVDDD